MTQYSDSKLEREIVRCCLVLPDTKLQQTKIEQSYVDHLVSIKRASEHQNSQE